MSVFGFFQKSAILLMKEILHALSPSGKPGCGRSRQIFPRFAADHIGGKALSYRQKSHGLEM